MKTSAQKEEYSLDLNTGFVKSTTAVMKSALYKNRFIPWTAPIPPSGRVDLEDFQRQLSQKSEQSADDLALFEAFKEEQRKKKEEAAAKAVAGIKAAETGPQFPPAGVPETGTTQASTTGTGSNEADKVAESAAAPVLTAGQRLDKITSAIPALTEEDFTKSLANPLPTVKALSEKVGFDVEGAERDTAWEEFKKQFPEWKPKHAGE